MNLLKKIFLYNLLFGGSDGEGGGLFGFLIFRNLYKRFTGDDERDGLDDFLDNMRS